MNEIPMPAAVGRLPRDKHGRPVPWFVAYIDGEPDFRVIRRGGIEDAHRYGWCWVCGQPIAGRYKAFVIGPMCAVNRVSAEPPGHQACAIYSALACPFLSTPNMVRRDRQMPVEHSDPAGIMLERNPGVALVWTTTHYAKFAAPGGPGFLFDIGEPDSVAFYAQGRPATRAEVLASIESGLPTLREMAEADGPEAVAALDEQTAAALELIPA